MQSDAVLNSLKDLAEKLGVRVSEQVLKGSGVHVRSGLCKVRGEDRFILDKKLPIGDKLELLSDCLCLMDINGVFVVPQLRDYLAKHKKKMLIAEKEAEGAPSVRKQKVLDERRALDALEAGLHLGAEAEDDENHGVDIENEGGDPDEPDGDPEPEEIPVQN